MDSSSHKKEDDDRQMTKKDGSGTTENMDSMDDDIKALIEKWQAMDKKAKSNRKTSTKRPNKVSGTTKEGKDKTNTKNPGGVQKTSKTCEHQIKEEKEDPHITYEKRRRRN